MSVPRIGELADRTDTSAPTIGCHEHIGPLRRTSRHSGTQRVCRRADVERLTFVRRCRKSNFSVEQVRVLLGGLGKYCGCGSIGS